MPQPALRRWLPVAAALGGGFFLVLGVIASVGRSDGLGRWRQHPLLERLLAWRSDTGISTPYRAPPAEPSRWPEGSPPMAMGTGIDQHRVAPHAYVQRRERPLPPRTSAWNGETQIHRPHAPAVATRPGTSPGPARQLLVGARFDRRDAGHGPAGRAWQGETVTGPPEAAWGMQRGPEHLSQRLLMGIHLNLDHVDRNSTAYARFKTWVDNAVAGSPGYAFEATDAAMMYQLTGSAPYCDLAVRMVEQQVAAAEAAIAAGGVPQVAGDSYLEVGPMIADLGQTKDTCAHRLSPQQHQRWSAYAEQAIWNVWNHASARWGDRAAPWTGWSVDNPGNNYHYSFLTATAYWALADGRHREWVPFLRDRKLPLLRDYYAQLPGGGSREGTGYGTAQMRLFTLYRIWRDAVHVDLGNANTHLTDTIRYWTHATVPTLDRFAPFGDQSRNSVPELYDYHRRLMLEARAVTIDAPARQIASWWLNNISVQQMSSGFNLRHDLLPAGTGGTPPAELLYHASGTGHLFARTGWDRNAMWVAFAAGPYVESHAHQDQGAFTLFSGDWMAVTSNIWSASGIEQATDMHNIVRFERSGAIVPQREGTTSSMAVTRGTGYAFSADADLTPAYGADSPIIAWRRRLEFADRRLTVRDSFQLATGTAAIYQTHVPTQPTISGLEVTTTRMRMRVLAPANAVVSSVAMGGGRHRIEVRGGASGYTVEYSEP